MTIRFCSLKTILEFMQSSVNLPFRFLKRLIKLYLRLGLARLQDDTRPWHKCCAIKFQYLKMIYIY